MYDIKELTWEYHKNAERQAFVKVLMSGEIPEKLYAVFLYNQYNVTQLSKSMLKKIHCLEQP